MTVDSISMGNIHTCGPNETLVISGQVFYNTTFGRNWIKLIKLKSRFALEFNLCLIFQEDVLAILGRTW